MWSDLTIWDFAAIAAKFLAYAGGFVAAGSALFAMVNGERVSEIRRSLNAVCAFAVVIATAATAAQFFVQSGRLMDEGMVGMLDPDMIELVSGAPLGVSVFVRVSGLVLLMLTFLPLGAFTKVAGMAGVLLVAASFSFVGHGTGDPRWLLSSLVTVHLVAVIFWIGALMPLYALSHSTRNISVAGDMAHRFGQQAAFVVGILIAIGAFLGWWLIGSMADLFGSQYGLTFLAKLTIVAGLLALATANKFRFVPAMMRGDQQGAVHLRHSIRWETLAIATILIITAVLTTVTQLPMSQVGDAVGSTMENMDHGN